MKSSFSISPFLVLTVGLIFAVTPQSVVAAQGSLVSPLPPGRFQFAGEWECRGAFATGAVHESRYSASLILEGKWIELNEIDTKPATKYTAKYLIGYSPQEKRLVEFDASNLGASTYSSELGWQNNMLAMTSSLATDPEAKYVLNRFRYAIAGPDTFIVDWQISKTTTSKWVTEDHLECKRIR